MLATLIFLRNEYHGFLSSLRIRAPCLYLLMICHVTYIWLEFRTWCTHYWVINKFCCWLKKLKRIKATKLNLSQGTLKVWKWKMRNGGNYLWISWSFEFMGRMITNQRIMKKIFIALTGKHKTIVVVVLENNNIVQSSDRVFYYHCKRVYLEYLYLTLFLTLIRVHDLLFPKNTFTAGA